MSKATLARAVSECHQNLAGVEEKIRELLADVQVLNVDETGMQVNGIRQWLHVASTEILTAYGHHRRRGSQAMDHLQILSFMDEFSIPFSNTLAERDIRL